MDMEPENDCAWKPKEGLTFDLEQGAYDFCNAYGGRMWFSIRRDYCSKNKFTNQLSESFNIFLKDYIRSDFNLNEFFMRFERVLYEK
ncbi:hypothetical protein ACSBR1_038770 [Camellia fascicularis]